MPTAPADDAPALRNRAGAHLKVPGDPDLPLLKKIRASAVPGAGPEPAQDPA